MRKKLRWEKVGDQWKAFTSITWLVLGLPFSTAIFSHPPYWVPPLLGEGWPDVDPHPGISCG